MNLQQFMRCTGAGVIRATARLPAYTTAMAAYGIDTSPRRVVMFLANVGEETGGFQWSSEIWGPTDAQRRYERDAQAAWPPTDKDDTNRLAYSLGNANLGDGRRYRGHGDLQVTGRTNHVAATLRLRAKFPEMDVPDFEATPEALALPTWAALSACDYVDRMGCNAQADAGNFDHYCDLINRGRITAAVGDSNGYAGRNILYHAGCAALGLA